MCIKSHEVCVKSMNKFVDSEVDEAYITETYDSESDTVTGARCCICSETFESMDLLRSHCLMSYSTALYEDPQENQCVVCGVQYELSEHLVNHISIFNQHETEERNHLESQTLELRLPKYRRNKKSFRGKYKPGIAYKCHICHKNIRGYVSHLKREHPNDPTEFRCHVCLRSDSVMNSLISHMHNVHCNPHKFKCDICDKVFARNVLMEQHRETVHFNVKNFECDLCHLKFARKQHLAVHAKVHLKQKLLKCKLCNIEFKEQPELDEHLFKHVYSENVHVGIF